jgi:hypothetical protein
VQKWTTAKTLEEVPPCIGRRGERRGREAGSRRWGLTPLVFNIEAKGGESTGRPVEEGK